MRGVYVSRDELNRPLISVLQRGRLKRYRRMSQASIRRALRLSVSMYKRTQAAQVKRAG